MLFLEQLLISAATCHIDSNNILNSELKRDLSNYVKAKIIEFTTPPQ